MVCATVVRDSAAERSLPPALLPSLPMLLLGSSQSHTAAASIVLGFVGGVCGLGRVCSRLSWERERDLLLFSTVVPATPVVESEVRLLVLLLSFVVTVSERRRVSLLLVESCFA